MAFIELKNVSVIYKEGTPLEAMALENISLSICENEFIGIIVLPVQGNPHLCGSKRFNRTHPEKFGRGHGPVTYENPGYQKGPAKIGLVFQYPENQVFEESIAGYCFLVP